MKFNLMVGQTDLLTKLYLVLHLNFERGKTRKKNLSNEKIFFVYLMELVILFGEMKLGTLSK